MYPPSTIRKIRHQLAAGVPHRRIAKQLGVSRGLVGKVSTGDRTKRPRVEPERPVRFQWIPRTRCGSCGAIVTRCPCPSCFHRAAARARRRPAAEL